MENLNAHVEIVLALGNSLYFYKYGAAVNNIKQDFPGIKILKTSLAVEGDDLVKMPKSVGVGIIELSTIFDNEKPDMIMTVADRYETLATAIAASYVNIPLVHLQGGEISGTIDDKVRNAITQLADYHFPATHEAADRVLQMKPKDHSRIWGYGCPSMDLLYEIVPNWKLIQEEVNRHGHGDKLILYDNYCIVMLHPDTKGEQVTGDQVQLVFEALDAFDDQKLVMWPNIDPGSDSIAKGWRLVEQRQWNSPIRYIRHLDSEIFGPVLSQCRFIIGNSSAGIREATFLGRPSISIGDRQEGRECGKNVVRVPFNRELIRKAIKKQRGRYFAQNNMYGDGHAGERIAKQLVQILGSKKRKAD